MDAETLRQLKRTVDTGFREFTRSSGAGLEQFFEPLGDFLLFCERLLTGSPWPLVLAAILGLIWLSSRSWKIVAGACVTLLSPVALAPIQNIIRIIVLRCYRRHNPALVRTDLTARRTTQR